jgi:hypothetical protein
MTGDWRDYRPAIWIAMVAVAVALLVQPWSLALPLLGGAVGFALGVPRRRRRAEAANKERRPEPARKRTGRGKGPRP